MKESDYKRIVCETILRLAQGVQIDAASRLNERHLHHAFSHLLQKLGLSLGVDGTPATLHPEWPTRKKGTGIWYTVYAKRERRYLLDNPNIGRLSPGFLDFAIGEDYQKPLVGVEFTFKRTWDSEEITYDLMKLMDPVLPFELSASLNVVHSWDRPDFVDRSGHLVKAYAEARDRLVKTRGDFRIRELFFILVAILGADRRRFWHLASEGDVQDGLPILSHNTRGAS